MLDRQHVLQDLATLDWSVGYDREGLLRALLNRNLALPNEFLSAIPPLELFYSPEQLVASVPAVVWTIHAERERRAHGQLAGGAQAPAAQRTRAA
jgi:hypothetical protein